MAKGIRVIALAKELGVQSKDVLEKLRAEGLGDKATSPQSTLGVGLAETVREWFHHGHSPVATAVETAPPVPAEAPVAKPKASRKKHAEQAESLPAETGEVAVEVAEPEAKPKHHRTKKDETPVAEVAPVVAESAAPVAPAAPAPVQPPAVTTPPAPVAEAPAVAAPVAAAPVEVVAAPVTAPAEPTIVAPPAPIPTPAEPAAAVIKAAPATPAAPAASAAPAPAAPAAPKAPAKIPPSRQVITPTPPPVRKPVVSTATKLVPAPAKIQGPRVVRIEKEETVNIRGPRPRGPGIRREGDATATAPIAPRGGRGVKVSKADEEGGEGEEAKKAGVKGTKGSLSSRRRGPDGRRGEANEKLKEYTDADLLERQERLAAATGYRAGFDSHLKKKTDKQLHGPAKSIIERGEPVEIEEPVTVRSLAQALGLKHGDIIGKLMRKGVFATVNQALDMTVAATIAMDYNIELLIKKQPSLEDQVKAEFDARVPEPKDLIKRPAVVTILGHVDHGKTSLLDKIRNANVAAGEAGGITQHTAAWMVEVTAESGEKKRVTFIDTPGHQAFTAMRARGANMTDVVVLVVSAAEGVQPQTVESINHARAAGVPIVVAMNKIDRVDANADMILGQLAKEGINPVEWGGDTEVIRTSATTGQGIKELIEMLDYQSELLELKTDPKAPARGTVIESRMEGGLGSVATVLVQEGTLKPGDILICGNAYGRIRQVLNDRMERIDKATASMPVVISGLNELPKSGDHFYSIGDLDRAKAIAEERQNLARAEQAASKTAVSLDSILQSMEAQTLKEIRLIIKGDVQGSVETLQKAVLESQNDEVKIHVVHAAVGAINESDVELADASKAVIIGFNVAPDESARALAEQRRIEVRLYRVIYELLDHLRKAASGMLAPEIREKYHGRAEVRQVFKVSRIGNIAGCMVIDGHIQRGSKIRLLRDGAVLVEDLALESLRRVKDDVKEAKQGFECGMKLAGYDDIKVGDVFEAYIRETIQRTL